MCVGQRSQWADSATCLLNDWKKQIVFWPNFFSPRFKRNFADCWQNQNIRNPGALTLTFTQKDPFLGNLLKAALLWKKFLGLPWVNLASCHWNSPKNQFRYNFQAHQNWQEVSQETEFRKKERLLFSNWLFSFSFLGQRIFGSATDAHYERRRTSQSCVCETTSRFYGEE